MNHDAVQNRDDRGKDLNQKFGPGPQGNNIVNRAGRHNDDRAKQNPAYFARNVYKQEHRQQKTEENGQTAHSGDRMVVDAARFAGYVHRADLGCKRFHDRRDRKADDKGDNDGQQKPDPDRSIQKHRFLSPNSYLATKPTFL